MSLCATQAQNMLYVLGGFRNTTGPLNTAFSFSPEAGKWASLPNLTVPRSQHGCAALPNGAIVAVGGWNNHCLSGTTSYALFGWDHGKESLWNNFREYSLDTAFSSGLQNLQNSYVSIY